MAKKIKIEQGKTYYSTEEKMFFKVLELRYSETAGCYTLTVKDLQNDNILRGFTQEAHLMQDPEFIKEIENYDEATLKLLFGEKNEPRN